MNDLEWREATEEEKISRRIYKELTGPVYEGHHFSIRPPHPNCMNCGLLEEQTLHTHCKEVEDIPDYCSPKMISAVEEAIEKRGLQEAYIVALLDVLGVYEREQDDYISSCYTFFRDLKPINSESDSVKMIWELLRATPLQKCQAALKAVEKE